MGNVLRLEVHKATPWEEALADFLNLKRAEGKSRYTLRDYRAHLTRFFTRFPLALGRPESIRSALLEYLAEDIQPATYNLRLAYLKAFFNWAVEEGLISNDPARGIRKRKDPGKFVSVETRTLTVLLSLPDKSTYAGLRDYTLMLLSLDTGIRPGEALQLLPTDFNLRGLELTIPQAISKTRTQRTLPLSPPTVKSCRQLLNARHPQWGNSVPLFCSSDGKVLAVTSWGKRLLLYGSKIEMKITPYQLRHAFATLYLRQGGDALMLQRILGHSGLAMTKRYVHLANEDLKERHIEASPVNLFVEEKTRM